MASAEHVAWVAGWEFTTVNNKPHPQELHIYNWLKVVGFFIVSWASEGLEKWVLGQF